MSMVGANLADAVRSSMSFPSPTSAPLVGWGSGTVDHVITGKVNHALVSGSTSPGGSLSGGTAVGGLISTLSGSAMANLVKSSAGYPSVSAELSAFCNSIVDHLQSQGLVNFAPGSIIGQCTNGPTSPGPLANGAGSNGTILGLSGSTLAQAVHGAAGYPGSVSAPLTSFCTAIVDYIMANAQASYDSGSVIGTCPPGGGPLSGGVGLNGKIA